LTISEWTTYSGNVKTTHTRFNYSGVQNFSDTVCKVSIR
jgi:hypothetical protein